MSRLQDVVGKGSRLGQMIVLARPEQWVKNAFVAVPLLLTRSAVTPNALVAAALGVVAFSLVASAIYVLNDYIDREADRAHPEKRFRPLAARTVSTPAAVVLLGALLTGGLALSAWLSLGFLGIVLVYAALNAGYSLALKNVAILDVFTIAAGFVLRIQAGAILSDIDLTVWITIITGLLALFLALGKRRDDVVRSMDTGHRRSLDGYNKQFLDASMTVVLGALLVAYLIYTTDADVLERMGTERLYLTAPFVVAGIMRYLQMMLVEERSGSPIRVALTDRLTLGAIAGWMATLGWLIYG